MAGEICVLGLTLTSCSSVRLWPAKDMRACREATVAEPVQFLAASISFVASFTALSCDSEGELDTSARGALELVATAPEL